MDGPSPGSFASAAALGAFAAFGSGALRSNDLKAGFSTVGGGAVLERTLLVCTADCNGEAGTR